MIFTFKGVALKAGGLLQKTISRHIPRVGLSVSGHWRIAVEISFQVDMRGVTDALDDVAGRQVPFLASRLVNLLAGDVQGQLKRRLPVVFDRPTPFTVRGVFTKLSKKTNPVATVYFPESQEESGKALREYVRPGAKGGLRNQKKTEYLLSRMGYLPSGWVTVPGKSMPLDGYGNLSGAYYKQIIRGLAIKNTKGPPKPLPAASRKRADRMGVDAEFFAVNPGANQLAKGGGWLPPGVWRRSGRRGEHLTQYLKFVRKASYKQRLDVKKEAQTTIAANLNRRYTEAVQDIVQRFNAK